MKSHKKISLVWLLLSIVVSLNAQWELQGNVPSTGEFLGTKNAYPLELKTTNSTSPQPINFYTNNEPRMSITGEGTVGIGSSGATYSETLVSISQYNSNAFDFLRIGNTFVTPGSPPTVSENTYFIVKENGNVGIGIADPQALLHISSNKAWAAYSDDVLLQTKIAATNADGNAFFFVSDMSYDNSDHVNAGFLGLSTAPNLISFAIINEVDEKVALGVSGEGRMVVNMGMNDEPLAQVDIRPLAESETVLNIGNLGAPPLFTVKENGGAGIGIYPPYGTLALKGIGGGTELDMYATASEGYNMQIRMIDGNNIRHIITDDPTSGTDALMILPGYSGTSNHRLWVQGVLGVGVNATNSALAVKGGSDTKLDLFETSSTVSYNAQLRFISSAGSARHIITENSDGELLFDIGNGGAADKVVFAGDVHVTGITDLDGRVKIGNVTVPNPDYMLICEKGILAERYKCALKSDATNWSDYVFAKDYKLMSIAALEKYVKKNHHLPNIPSAEEVYKNGIDLANMDALLLEKIEELSLYIIELKKRVDSLSK